MGSAGKSVLCVYQYDISHSLYLSVLLQLPSVLSDVCGLTGLLLKKQGKYPKPMYMHYVFLPDSIINALLLQHFSDQVR